MLSDNYENKTELVPNREDNVLMIQTVVGEIYLTSYVTVTGYPEGMNPSVAYLAPISEDQKRYTTVPGLTYSFFELETEGVAPYRAVGFEGDEQTFITELAPESTVVA